MATQNIEAKDLNHMNSRKSFIKEDISSSRNRQLCRAPKEVTMTRCD